MRVVLFRENLENVKGRWIFREICENFRVSGGILPIIRKFGRLLNDSGDLPTLHIFWIRDDYPMTEPSLVDITNPPAVFTLDFDQPVPMLRIPYSNTWSVEC